MSPLERSDGNGKLWKIDLDFAVLGGTDQKTELFMYFFNRSLSSERGTIKVKRLGHDNGSGDFARRGALHVEVVDRHSYRTARSLK